MPWSIRQFIPLHLFSYLFADSIRSFVVTNGKNLLHERRQSAGPFCQQLLDFFQRSRASVQRRNQPRNWRYGPFAPRIQKGGNSQEDIKPMQIFSLLRLPGRRCKHRHKKECYRVTNITVIIILQYKQNPTERIIENKN